MESKLALARTIKLPVFVLLVVAVAVSIIAINQLSSRPAEVLGTVMDDDQVQVQATVNGCILNITVLPERRIPVTGNFDTQMNVQIVNTATQVQAANLTLNTNTAGFVSTNLCNQGIFPPAANYDYRIRGISHLRSTFASQSSFNFQETTFNFSSGGTRLRAGDTYYPQDNKVNSLDLSTQIANFYTANNINDLNQDGRVNSLDISNTLVNFYAVGN